MPRSKSRVCPIRVRMLAHGRLRNPRGMIQHGSVVTCSLPPSHPPSPFLSEYNFLRASSVRISLIVRVCSITVRCALVSFRRLIQRAIHTNRSKIASHVNGGFKINALLDVTLSVGNTN